MRAARVVSFIACSAILAACETEDPCIESLPADCAPQYEPTFENLFAQTLKPTCAQAGPFCHAAEGAKKGMVFEDIDVAYLALTGDESGMPRAVPMDAACSLLMHRIASDDPNFVMPPGMPLAAGQRCVFQKWIQNGAQR